MTHRLARISEKMATSVGESRRSFLLGLGQGVLATAGTLAGLLMTRSPSFASPGIEPSGACNYTTNGTATCEQMTQVQCASIPGSTWYSGRACTA